MTIFRRFVHDRRGATGWWMVGMVALAGFTAAFWPTIRGQSSFDELARQLPEGMRSMLGIDVTVSISSAPGYLQGRVFGTILPVVLIVHAIGLGASVVAGPESDRTIELVLANPVSRHRLYAERSVGTIVVSILPAGVAALSLILLGLPVGLMEGVDVGAVAVATLAAWALAALFGAAATAVGAATGRRSMAVSVAARLAVAGYLVQGLMSAARAPEYLLELVPWHWYVERNALIQGVEWKALALPIAVAALLTSLGGWRFGRRDLR